MKRIFLIGTALLLIVLPLAGCGVAQEDLDDAIAERDAAEAQVSSLQSKVSAAESDLAAAESDLAAAESDLAAAESAKASADSAKASADSAKATAVSAKAAAESDLAAAEAEIADLEAQIATLEAAAEEEVVEEEEEVVEEEEEEVVEEEEEVVEEVAEVELTFEAATYTNEEYGFSVRYPAHWVAAEEISEEAAAAQPWLVFSASSSASVPSVQVSVGDYEEGQTLADIILDITSDADATVEADYGEVTLPGGITAQAVWVAWIGMGYPLDSYIIGVVKDGKWFAVNVFTCFLLIAYDEASQGEIAQTIRFD